MSRTKKGKKSPGWDYWGKRPIGSGDHGTKGKRSGIQKERAKNKAQERKVKREKDDS
jgi:hypothetical protein